MAGPARVVVDVLGGDRAPSVVLEGVAHALAADLDVVVILTGPADVVEPFAAAHERCEAHPTTEFIEMAEHPAAAVRSKKDSSIVVGCRLVKEGAADAFFSAGNTGAAMAAATLLMGRIPGVDRPAIATVLPTPSSPVVLLDSGANADCRPEYLVQFAHMGDAYAQAVLGVAAPRIALLNIGEEPGKGSQLAQDAHALMRDTVRGFVGNIEGRDVIAGTVDVIVTDGFTGNITLKLLEGTSRTLLGEVRSILSANLLTKFGALFARKGFGRLRARLDPDAHGGAPLLGVKGICIIGHGSSSSNAISSAIRVAATAVRGDLTGRITAELAPPSA